MATSSYLVVLLYASYHMRLDSSQRAGLGEGAWNPRRGKATHQAVTRFGACTTSQAYCLSSGTSVVCWRSWLCDSMRRRSGDCWQSRTRPPRRAEFNVSRIPVVGIFTRWPYAIIGPWNTRQFPSSAQTTSLDEAERCHCLLSPTRTSSSVRVAAHGHDVDARHEGLEGSTLLLMAGELGVPSLRDIVAAVGR